MHPAHTSILLRLKRHCAVLCLALGVAGVVQAAGAASTPGASSTATAPYRLRIVGGLAGISQYIRQEEPFWTKELSRLSAGRFQAEIVPFDRAGVPGAEMLRLLQLGVVPFGTTLMSSFTAQYPEYTAPDLAGLNPDIATLKTTLAAFRPYLEKALREQHGVEALAIYVYPAQVVFCKKPLRTLSELTGRRVRVSSASQADFVGALGGVPVLTSFSQIVPSLTANNTECAITGTMSGNILGLPSITTHVHTLPVTWGLAVFGANQAAWAALPADLRTLLQWELPRLEAAIWAESERETADGLACNRGHPPAALAPRAAWWWCRCRPRMSAAARRSSNPPFCHAGCSVAAPAVRRSGTRPSGRRVACRQRLRNDRVRSPSRIRAYVWAGAAVFVAAVVAVAGTLAWNARQAALADSEAQATRFVAGAEAALNRSLLAVDVLLASMDELLGLSNAMPKWLDPDTASQRLRGSARQNLMVRYVAVLDGSGKALASSDPAGASLSVQLPAGFLESVLEQPVSTLMVSAPVVSFASSEKVLYFARHLRMADSSRVVAVAELPVSALSSVLVQGVDISGLQVTLERATGQLLLSVPNREDVTAPTLAPPLAIWPIRAWLGKPRRD